MAIRLENFIHFSFHFWNQMLPEINPYPPNQILHHLVKKIYAYVIQHEKKGD